MSEKGRVVVVTCSGAANTGVIANDVAVKLCNSDEKFSLLCLPALALDMDNPLNKVENAEKLLIIEGCPVKCASKLVEQKTGRTPDLAVQMAERYGIKKVHELKYDEDDLKKAFKDLSSETGNW